MSRVGVTLAVVVVLVVAPIPATGHVGGADTTPAGVAGAAGGPTERGELTAVVGAAPDGTTEPTVGDRPPATVGRVETADVASEPDSSEANETDEYRTGDGGAVDVSRPEEPPLPENGTVGTQATATPTNVSWAFELTPNTPGEILLHIDYEFPAGKTYFYDYVGSRETVMSSTNLTRPESYLLRWDGSQNPSGPDASVTLALAVNSTGFGKQETVDVGPWALSRAHPTYFYDDYGPVNLTVADRSVEGERVTYGGFATSDGYAFVFIGDQTTATYQAEGQSIRVVRPAAASGRPLLDTVGAELVRESAALRVGAREPQVTAFVAPDPIRGGGRSYGVDFWMGDGEPARDATPTLLHEYVHTRQVFNFTESSRTDSMAWFVEASASLYETLLAWRFNYSSFADYRVETWNSPSRVVLANDSTYTDANGNPVSPGYEEGHAVLAALDYRIRVATDGEASFQDVFRRVNARAANETVNATDLQTVAETVAGRSFEPFFDRYVRSQALPDPPDDPSAYPVETVPVTGAVSTAAPAGPDSGSVYAFTVQTDATDEVFARPDRPPKEWDYRDVYGRDGVTNGAWQLPVDPNRTETEPNSPEATWNYTFAYVQPQTRATAGDGVPDIYPVATGVAPSASTGADVGTTTLPEAARLNVTVVDTGGTPRSGVRVSVGVTGFAGPIQADTTTGTEGRAFADRGVPGLDLAGEVDLVVDGATADANVQLSSGLPRATHVRYVVGTTGVATGTGIPDDSVRAGDSVRLYLVADRTEVSGSSQAVPVEVDGQQVTTVTVTDGSDDDVVVPVDVTFQSAGTHAVTIGGLSAGSVDVEASDAAGELPTSIDAPATATAGTSVVTNATVSTPDVSGTATGTATLEVLVNGTTVDTTSVTVTDDETRTLSFAPTLTTPGPRNLTVRSNVTLDGTAYVGAATATVTVERPANLTVLFLESNEPVAAGETLSVSPTVENVGDRTATQTVAYTVDGTRRDSQTVTLAPGESRTVPLNWSTTSDDAGTYAAAVATANDTATRSLTVVEPPLGNLTIDAASTASPVRAGERLSVTTTVANRGDGTASQTVSLAVDGGVRDTVRVSLAPSATETVTLNWTTATGDAGSYVATVATANDTATRAVEVTAPSFSLSNVTVDDTVAVGGEFGATAVVANEGTANGTTTLAVSIEGDRIAETAVTVGAGGAQSVTLTPAVGNRSPGTYTATVSVANGSATGAEPLSIVRPPDPIANDTSLAAPTDPDGDGEYEDVDGDGNATYQDVVVLFEYFESVLADGATATAAFDFDGDGRLSYVDLVALFESVGRD